MPDTSVQQWFLRDRKLDVNEAADKLVRMMEWRRAFMPRPLTGADVAEEAASGKAYLHDHKDINGRPVIIVRARRHITGESRCGNISARHCPVAAYTCNVQANGRWKRARGCAHFCWSRRSASSQKARRPSWASLTCAALAPGMQTWALCASW